MTVTVTLAGGHPPLKHIPLLLLCVCCCRDGDGYARRRTPFSQTHTAGSRHQARYCTIPLCIGYFIGSCHAYGTNSLLTYARLACVWYTPTSIRSLLRRRSAVWRRRCRMWSPSLVVFVRRPCSRLSSSSQGAITFACHHHQM